MFYVFVLNLVSFFSVSHFNSFWIKKLKIKWKSGNIDGRLHNNYCKFVHNNSTINSCAKRVFWNCFLKLTLVMYLWATFYMFTQRVLCGWIHCFKQICMRILNNQREIIKFLCYSTGLLPYCTVHWRLTVPISHINRQRRLQDIIKTTTSFRQ